jgi:uncharacterized protein YaiL (DUF2058 family)
VSLAKSLFNKEDQQKDLALLVRSTSSYLMKDQLKVLLGGEVTMIELANYLSDGEFMEAKAGMKAETARADAEKARADAEKARADRADADKARAEKDAEKARADAEKARLEKIIFKMKLSNLDLPTISSFTGLKIEEIEQILN